MTTAKERIIHYVIAAGEMGREFNTMGIAKELEMPFKSVSCVVSYLKQAGIIEPTFDSCYQSTGDYSTINAYEEIDKRYREISNIASNKSQKKNKKGRKNKFQKEEVPNIELTPFELGDKLFAYIYELRLRIKECEEAKEDNNFLMNENIKLKERITQLTEQINSFNQRKKLF